MTRIALAAALLLAGCATLDTPAATQANSAVAATEATVCRSFGTYYMLKTSTGFRPPDSLGAVEDVVAKFCSADPVAGSTPRETLENMARLALVLLAAQAPAR